MKFFGSNSQREPPASEKRLYDRKLETIFGELLNLTLSIKPSSKKTKSHTGNKKVQEIHAKWSFGSIEHSFLEGKLQMNISLKKVRLFLKGNLSGNQLTKEFYPDMFDIKSKFIKGTSTENKVGSTAKANANINFPIPSLAAEIISNSETQDTNKEENIYEMEFKSSLCDSFTAENFHYWTFTAPQLPGWLAGDYSAHISDVFISNDEGLIQPSKVIGYFVVNPNNWIFNYGDKKLPKVQANLFKWAVSKDYRDRITAAKKQRSTYTRYSKWDDLEIFIREVELPCPEPSPPIWKRLFRK